MEQHTAEGAYDTGPKPAHALPGYTRRWKYGGGYHSAFAFDLDTPLEVVALAIAASSEQAAEFHLRGVTLLAADGSQLPVPVRAGDPLWFVQGDLVDLQAHRGLKVYRHAVLPRAYVVRQALIAPGTPEAIAGIRSDDFDPRWQVVLERQGPAPGGFMAGVRDVLEGLGIAPPRQGARGLDAAGTKALERAASFSTQGRLTFGSGAPGGRVAIVQDQPERVAVRAELEEAGLLVLMDSFYPDWEARIDGEPTPLVRANHNYRAVLVPAGVHVVEFTCEPGDFRLGWIVSLVTALALVVTTLVTWRAGRLA